MQINRRDCSRDIGLRFNLWYYLKCIQCKTLTYATLRCRISLADQYLHLITFYSGICHKTQNNKNKENKRSGNRGKVEEALILPITGGKNCMVLHSSNCMLFCTIILL